MPRQIDMMRMREEKIRELFEILSKSTKAFTQPKLITIGGYALRAYIPFSRYTRDCDFVMKKGSNWFIDEIKELLSEDINVEILEKKDGHGFLHLVNIIQSGKMKVKIAMDFMEGEVRGRTDEQIIVIDDKFIKASKRAKIPIADKDVEIFVPDYQDYLIMKVVSGRPSDVRDIAALIWMNGAPDSINNRIEEILPHPEVFPNNIHVIVMPAISDRRFVNSWRGTFISSKFSDESKRDVLSTIEQMI